GVRAVQLGLRQAGLGLRHVGLSLRQIPLGRRSRKRVERGLALLDRRLRDRDIIFSAAEQLVQLRLGLGHACLGRRYFLGSGVLQRVELALGVGQLRFGQRHIGGFLLTRVVVGDLRLPNAFLGAIESRLRLHKSIVVLLALGVV